MDTKFAEQLKFLRTERGLSQQQLADYLGLGQTSVSYWERGNKAPTLFNFIRIANFFDVSLDYLCGRKDY